MRVALPLSFLLACIFCTCCCFKTSLHQQFLLRKVSTSLHSEDPDLVGSRGMKGYYRRPSRAIEKGGGFYVPGLEGEKIRIVSASFTFIRCKRSILNKRSKRF